MDDLDLRSLERCIEKGAPKDLLEALADEEHSRWAHWQRYLHSRCTRQLDGCLTIPCDLVQRWERQIETPYPELQESEKNSDREQARKLLSSIKRFILENGID